MGRETLNLVLASIMTMALIGGAAGAVNATSVSDQSVTTNQVSESSATNVHAVAGYYACEDASDPGACNAVSAAGTIQAAAVSVTIATATAGPAGTAFAAGYFA